MPTAGQCPCTLPAYLTSGKFSLITKGNALVSAHNVYTGLAIGTTMTVFEPNTSKTVGGKSFMQAISPVTDHRVNFNGGIAISSNPLGEAGIDFAVLETFATKVKPSDVNGYKVVVFTQGGTYTMDNVRPSGYQDEDNGLTLVVFNTSENVRLAFGNNRKWGPSVLAPFSEVTIDDNNAFNDGYIVAKTFKSTQTYQQLHGDPYKGTTTCSC
jgi:hypothetical protein